MVNVLPVAWCCTRMEGRPRRRTGGWRRCWAAGGGQLGRGGCGGGCCPGWGWGWCWSPPAAPRATPPPRPPPAHCRPAAPAPHPPAPASPPAGRSHCTPAAQLPQLPQLPQLQLCLSWTGSWAGRGGRGRWAATRGTGRSWWGSPPARRHCNNQTLLTCSVLTEW